MITFFLKSHLRILEIRGNWPFKNFEMYVILEMFLHLTNVNVTSHAGIIQSNPKSNLSVLCRFTFQDRLLATMSTKIFATKPS